VVSYQARLVERQTRHFVWTRRLWHARPLAEAAADRLVVDSVCHFVVQNLAVVEVHQGARHLCVAVTARAHHARQVVRQLDRPIDDARGLRVGHLMLRIRPRLLSRSQ